MQIEIDNDVPGDLAAEILGALAGIARRDAAAANLAALREAFFVTEEAVNVPDPTPEQLDAYRAAETAFNNALVASGLEPLTAA